MGSILLSFPVLVVLVILQTAVVSRLPLLNGTADLVLVVLVAWSLQDGAKFAWVWALIAGLLVSFVSATPFMAPLGVYLVVTVASRLMQRRVWHMPVLAMFAVTFVGSLLLYGVTLVLLKFLGTPLPWGESISLIIVPSTFLNLILALPVYALVSDIHSWMRPVQEEEA